MTVGSSVPQVVADITNNPASISNGATGFVSLTVAGATTQMAFAVNAPSLETGLVMGQAICKVDGTVIVPITNTTGAPIDPASQTFRVIGF